MIRDQVGEGMAQDFAVEGETIRFWVKVKPRSRRERLRQTPSGELCLETTAPPLEGRANEALVNFLARALGLPRSQVRIQTGEHSRRKLLCIHAGPSARETIERLKAELRSGRRPS